MSPVVKVVEGGANGVPLDSRTFPFPLTPSGDALTYVSSKAGFQVTVPGYLPPGYLVTEIDIPPRPPAAIDSSGLPLHVFLKISNGSVGFQIQEANVRYTVDENPSHVIASPSAGSQIFKQGGAVGDTITAYTLVTPTSIVELTAGVPNPLTDDEVVRIMTSVP